MFKVCGITGICKIKFFKFSSTEKVKQYTKEPIFKEKSFRIRKIFYRTKDRELKDREAKIKGAIVF